MSTDTNHPNYPSIHSHSKHTMRNTRYIWRTSSQHKHLVVTRIFFAGYRSGLQNQTFHKGSSVFLHQKSLHSKSTCDVMPRTKQSQHKNKGIQHSVYPVPPTWFHLLLLSLVNTASSSCCICLHCLRTFNSLSGPLCIGQDELASNVSKLVITSTYLYLQNENQNQLQFLVSTIKSNAVKHHLLEKTFFYLSLGTIQKMTDFPCLFKVSLLIFCWNASRSWNAPLKMPKYFEKPSLLLIMEENLREFSVSDNVLYGTRQYR